MTGPSCGGRRQRARWPAVLATALVAGCAGPGQVVGSGTRGASDDAAVPHLTLPGATGTTPYSHVVVAGDHVHVAGTIGVEPETGRPPFAPADEVRLLLDGFRARLALAGCTMDDLVSVTVFCHDRDPSNPVLYDTFNRIYREYVSGPFPARAFVTSGPLLRGCRYEVTGVAYRPSESR